MLLTQEVSQQSSDLGVFTSDAASEPVRRR
jgi:hypothetical protein